MKLKPCLLFLSMFLANTIQAQEPSREIYQIKVYELETDEQVQRTDAYLENALLPALDRISPRQTGVFKPRSNQQDSLKKIYVLIPFSSIEAFKELDGKLAKDAAYLAAGEDYIEANYKNPPYQRIGSILLEAFEDMPFMEASSLAGARKDRIYELRSYHAPTEAALQNKLEMFNAGGEIEIFDELGFNAVFYGEVISGPEMPNLMYMTTFPNQESRDEHWQLFSDAPRWKALAAKEKYKDNVSHIDINFLYPTKYSDY